MSDLVSIVSQDKIINDIFKNNARLIVLVGKSGSGKSVILKKLSFMSLKYILIDKIINDLKDFQEFIIKHKNKNVVFLIDELCFYKDEIIEQIRIYSDDFSFVLSTHKDLKIFYKEHFKSRISCKINIEFLNLEELRLYLKDKFGLDCFLKKDLNFILKLSNKNIRNIDKLANSFKKIQEFYTQNNIVKTNKYILSLSAIENKILS